MSEPQVRDLLGIAPVVPVVVVESLHHAIPVARALVAGGLQIVELTLRTSVALDAIRMIADAVPEITLGAGTVTSPDLAMAARDAGASFLVSPGSTPRLLHAMLDTGLPFLPGTSTVSEVLRVLEYGVTQMKFFPAEASGGVAFLSSLTTVVPTARFCPTGGIGPATAPDYLALPNVGCVGGTWLTPKAAVDSGDWGHVRQLALAASGLRVGPSEDFPCSKE